jgi:hypothetical protein
MQHWVAGECRLTVKAVEVVNRIEWNRLHNAGWDGLWLCGVDNKRSNLARIGLEAEL